MNQVGDSRLQADHARIAELERLLDTLSAKERREFAWAEEYMAKSRSLEMALEAAQAQVATLTEQLTETREELEANRLCNRFTWKDRACKSERQVATLTEALGNAYEYLHGILSPCEPDCTCMLHIMEVALASVREETRDAREWQIATLTEALNEVVTNGEWHGADWSVSTDVYEMASAALASVREEQK